MIYLCWSLYENAQLTTSKEQDATTDNRSPTNMVPVGPPQISDTSWSKASRQDLGHSGFAKKNDLNLVEINFERSPEFKDLFERSLDPDRVVDNIELLIARPINRKKSLIFFDEIQDCPHAITALKHFTESSSAPPVVAAGSYLGMFEGQSEGISQPVGYVDEIEMWPVSFQEFLEASNPHPSLLAVLCDETRLDRTLHAKLLEIYREYLFVGGMPEVVRDWYRLKQNGESIFGKSSLCHVLTVVQ